MAYLFLYWFIAFNFPQTARVVVFMILLREFTKHVRPKKLTGMDAIEARFLFLTHKPPNKSLFRSPPRRSTGCVESSLVDSENFCVTWTIRGVHSCAQRETRTQKTFHPVNSLTRRLVRYPFASGKPLTSLSLQASRNLGMGASL
jgi:hypothetical protein